MGLTKYSFDGEVSETLNEEVLPWDNPPCPPQSTVTLAGRAEAGDVAELTGASAIVYSCDFHEDKGNTYTVIVDNVMYSNINPAMLTLISLPPYEGA